jgi:hypothetical protein
VSSQNYVLNVDVPTSPKGHTIGVLGLGEFKNGGTYDLDPEQVDYFRNYHGFVTDQGTWALGPTPVQATFPEGITAEVKKTEAPVQKEATK